MPLRRWLCPFAVAAVFSIALGAQTPSARPTAAIEPDALKEWLTYIASDELQGRQVYTEGLGLAAAYIADHLREWGVKPVGDNGSYFQTVKVTGVKTTSEATVTVRVNGETRTFKDGEGITFSRNMGGKQTIAGEQVLFAGYGLQIPNATIDDYANIDPRGKIVIWVGSAGPKAAASESRRLLSSTARSRLALEKGARAVIGPRVTGAFGRGGRGGLATPAPSASGGRGAGADVDFTTTERYDRPIPPALSATDEFFEFLFSGSELKYAQLKELADAQAPLAPFALKGVTLTIDVNPEYTTVNTRLTRNVVGVVEGTDPKLKNTYVVFSAHYDHTGYQQALPQAGISSGVSGGSAGGCEGQTRPTPRPGDVINNGADDDGSGTVALMGLAKAFALGPKPRRSLLFVWHTAEEGGLLGSRYNADYPVVPNEHNIAAHNIDKAHLDRFAHEFADRFVEIHHLNDAQVIIGADHARHHSDHGERHQIGPDGRHEYEILGEETGQRWNSGEREHEHGEDEGHQPVGTRKSGQLPDLLHRSVGPPHCEHAGEGAERHDHIDAHVDDDAAHPVRARRRQPHESEAHMPD